MNKIAEVRQQTTAEAVVDSLLAHGIDTVYALPGMQNDPLFDAFYAAQNRLRVVNPRHEQGAGYMALGAALATGKPQVYAVVPGPGFLNSSAALLTAQAMNAPVLGLIGQIPQSDIDRGLGHLHEIKDQLGIAGHMAKFTARIKSPTEAPGLVADALRHSLSGKRGPSVLECSLDIWGKKGAVGAVAPMALEETAIDEEALDRAARTLAAAKRPVMVVGGGAVDAADQVRRIAEMLEMPVISYRRGRGVLPTSHRLAVNMPVGHRLWRSTDACLAVGTRLLIQHAQWGMDAEMKVVRVDINPDEPDRLRRPTVALVGDAAVYLEALIERLPRYLGTRPSREGELAEHRAWLADRMSRLEPQASYLRAIRNALPANGVFVDEVTQIGFASRLAFPVEHPRQFLSAGYQDNLGWGYGTALGVKAAMPDTPVVAVAGDGGFMYQLSELATAVQHRIGLVVVVFDNQMYGNVRRIQQENFGGRFIASQLTNPDFAAVAQAFGMATWRVESPAELEAALKEALAANAPALVHVRCGEMPSPWDMLALPKIRGEGFRPSVPANSNGGPMSTATLVEPSKDTLSFLGKRHQVFIGGRFTDAEAKDFIQVFNPATGKVIATVPDCGPADIDRAVKAAANALEGKWASMRPADREAMILKLADLVAENSETLAQLETMNQGKSIGISRAIEVGGSVEHLRYMAGWTTKIEGSTLGSSIAAPPPGSQYFTYTVREPVGVVGAIVPWNFPLMMAVWKIAPALACGCTIVLKPSEETPLTALYLADLCAQAGIPEGVVNVVTGRGITAGAALAKHPGVAKLAFTGSVETGQIIGHAAIDNMARFTLELGGKSPMLVFSDVEPGLEGLMANLGMFFNQGQVCTAATRVLIEKSIYDTTLEKLAGVASTLSVGPGMDLGSMINPLVSQRQQQRVQGFLDRAEKAGAKHTRGAPMPSGGGFYVAPTIVHDVSPDMEIVQEEVFGPVITAMPFGSEEEAIRLANGTRYGLAASVWTKDLGKALRLTKAIKAGTVWVNTHNVLDPNLPFGGMKFSGIGREHGKAALDAYLETKTVMMRY